MNPHPSNACSGRYANTWLEVMLLPECNAKCSWCIERNGWHPTERVAWDELVGVALGSGRENVQLLGGEPTLHPDLPKIVDGLASAGRKVWITTNGSRLSREFVLDNLARITGVNVSIHHYDLEANAAITGVALSRMELVRACSALLEFGANVRLNCNCICGEIDSRSEMLRYIRLLARPLSASAVRFSELQGNSDAFVSVVDALDGDYGLTNDPFKSGCSVDAMLDGMPVNLRIMCGVHTPFRPRPTAPRQHVGSVLYYDGKLYDGWQTLEAAPMNTLAEDIVIRTVDGLVSGTVDPEEAKQILRKLVDSGQVQKPTIRSQAPVNKTAESKPHVTGPGCVY